MLYVIFMIYKLSGIHQINSFMVVMAMMTALVGCGGGDGTSNTGSASVSNGVPVQVTSGLQQQFANLLVTSVTVCSPGSGACKTIDNVQVDTGSTGLRLLASALGGLDLPVVQGGVSSASLFECAVFATGFVWGGLARADVKLAQEVASNLPIHIIQDGVGPNVPEGCKSNGVNQSNSRNLGVNGILGVGVLRQDCGVYCANNSANGRYFQCLTSGACTATTVATTNQISNPVANFTHNNNGVIIQLPSVPSNGASALSGEMVFGINTQTNNALPVDATVIPLDQTGLHAGRFTATLNARQYPDSFIDSGSSGYFFEDASLPLCNPNASNLQMFCPGNSQSTSVQTRNVTLQDGNVFQIQVANASYLYSQPHVAFSNLAGTATAAMTTSIDLGLPFFMGRRVFTGFNSQNNSPGYFAFKSN